MNIPNAITVARIALCPVVAWLALSSGAQARYLAFAVFLAAALSDLWDGHLARKHGWVSDTGKLLDPIADKLLMASGFVPIYFISRGAGGEGAIPWWGELPLWVLIVVFGREVFITFFRGYAARRGRVIAAGRSGKRKTLATNFFIGALLLLYALRATGAERGWEGAAWQGWELFHGAFVALTLALAVFLTLFSLADYIVSYRAGAVGR